MSEVKQAKHRNTVTVKLRVTRSDKALPGTSAWVLQQIESGTLEVSSTKSGCPAVFFSVDEKCECVAKYGVPFDVTANMSMLSPTLGKVSDAINESLDAFGLKDKMHFRSEVAVITVTTPDIMPETVQVKLMAEFEDVYKKQLPEGEPKVGRPTVTCR